MPEENTIRVSAASSALVATAVKNHLLPTLTGCSYLSPPLVNVVGQEACLAFLIGRGEILNQESGYQIWPPSLLAIYSARSGVFREIAAVKPADFDQTADLDEPAGAGVSPEQKNEVWYLNKQIRLYECCDALTDAILNREPSEPAAGAYRESLIEIAEPALWNYFDRLIPFRK